MEYAAGPMTTVAQGKMQFAPVPLHSLNLPASSRASEDDPFHDDWPHWEAACQWEQRALADGYWSWKVTS